MYICFLEQYQRPDEVDAFLQSQDEVVSKAVNVVLLGSLLNCTAWRRDWLRAETLWETFMKRQVRPNIISHNARAKVHLLAGRPGQVLEIYDNALTDFVRAVREDFRVAQYYNQALLVVCHSSLDQTAIKRLQDGLALSLKKGPLSPKSVREYLETMRSIAHKLIHAPKKVFLHDVLIDFKAKELSAMAEWENYPAGSHYLEAQGQRKDSGGKKAEEVKQGKKTKKKKNS